jgi:hypothetical protein
MSDQTRVPEDDALLAELRAVVGQLDPVPPQVSEAAKAVLGWRRLDADLAELLADSALESELAGVRSGTAHARSVTFAAPGLEIDVEIRRDNGRMRLLGQIEPPAPATVELQTEDGSTAASAETDALGRFRLELDASPGRARLRITRQDRVVETSWLSF